MERNRLLACVHLLFVLVVAPLGPAAAADARDRGAVVADRLLAALVEANGVPGMGAAVVHEGRVVWNGSAGMRDVDAGLPVDRDTAFRLASVSKLVTATAAAKLRDSRRLDVDAPVQSLLPWLEAPWAALTPRQLAAHTSGLPHYQDIDGDRGGTRYASVRDAVRVFEHRALLAEPGTAYRYSSWGYTLLSAVVEAKAGQPFLDFLARDVVPGLAIGADGTAPGGALLSKTYAFADSRAVPAPAHDFSYTWGGGGLVATPEAIALFGSRVMNGEVVSRRTFEWMLEPARLRDGTVVAERTYQVGFGWRVGEDADGEPIAHHAGVAEGARSALVLWPRRRLAASVLSNAQWVASIEQTAALLVAPFRARADAPVASRHACPVRTLRYEARFGDAPLRGAARFDDHDGLCTGRIELADSALRTWLNGFPQRDTDALEVIGLHHRGGLERAALVTPLGLYDLRPVPGTEATYRAELGADRVFEIELAGPGMSRPVTTGRRPDRLPANARRSIVSSAVRDPAGACCR